MTMIDTLRQNPQIKHGTIAIAFTPDEEVGGGIEKFDVKGFGAKFAYTVDGESLARSVTKPGAHALQLLRFRARTPHPGTQKEL
jgi:tripeptide aminopeptidase